MRRPVMPMSLMSAAVMLVSSVTAISFGARAPRGTASRAACSIARPPSACTFSIHTPSSRPPVHAAATVFGIS